MAFNRVGSVITQTGTDTDLSGITTALGAGNIFSNGGTPPLDRTVYDLATPNYTLVINGTLSFDPANEELWMPGIVNALDVGNSGTLNIGGTRSFSGGVSYSKEQAIFFDLRGSSHVAGNNAFMRVQTNGKFNWDGGVITNHAASDFLRDGIVNAGTLRLGTQLSSSTSQQYATFLQDITINDLLVDGLTRLVIRDANVQINGISLLHTAGLFADGNVAPNLTSYPAVQNYQAEFVEKDYTYWRGGKLRLRNSSVGSNAIANGNNVTSANSTGLLAIEQDFTLTVVDGLGNPITSGLWFIRDYDNGNRQNAGYTGGSGAANAAVNLLPDNTYNASFNAQGTHSPVTIVTAYGNRTSASSNEVGTYDTGPNRYDRRTKSDVQGGVNIDDMDVFVWSYEYLGTTLTPSLIGLGGTEITTTLFDDNNVTESNQTTVSGYTSLANLDQLYDRAKLEKVTLTLVEYPASDEQIINANGTELDLGSQNLVVTDAAGPAFSVDTGTNTITIKANDLNVGTKFASIRTTGNITFVSGGAINDSVVVTDASGSRVPVGIQVVDSITNLPVQGARVRLVTSPGGIEALNDVTDVNGEVNATFTLSADTQAAGPVRKGSGSPLYVATGVSGTITTSAGFSAIVSMVLDE